MNSVQETEFEIPEKLPDSAGPSGSGGVMALPASEARRNVLELGRWLAGIRGFVSPDNRMVVSDAGPGSDWSRELRIIQSALRHCSMLSWKLASVRNRGEIFDGPENRVVQKLPDKRAIIELAEELREALLSADLLLARTEGRFEDWAIWRKSLTRTLSSSPTVVAIIRYSEEMSGRAIPDRLARLISEQKVPGHWDTDLQVVLPRIATVLSYLRMIRGMLTEDQPLKSSLLLFARVDELIRDLMEFINSRLQRFVDEEDPLFGSLDGAAYTASIELRKVHAQELKGLVGIRPTPIVFARIETAHALLNDSLQMTLVNFAQLIDPGVESTDVFPELQTKEEQSIQLRKSLWEVLKLVQSAEQEPGSVEKESLHGQLLEFRDQTSVFLFYKDLETVERFIEEVVVTREDKDLVPLLHRFGAYLETLLGQVNMRVVLARHPFAPLQHDPHEAFV